jgi:hypothetical protein
MCSESVGRGGPLGEGAAGFRSAFASSASVPGRLASRATLLVGASLLALAALSSPRPAAACSGADRVSSPSTPGPIFGKGGNITVNAGTSIAGGPTGVYARNCGIGALSNSGAIGGAAGGSGAPGGIGVRTNSGQTVDLLTNATGATIRGGDGGSASAGGPAARACRILELSRR